MLEVLESRDKATLVAWLKQARESGVLAQVEEVTTDMGDGYVEAAKEVFGPQVRITIDRFHVAQNFQKCLNQARRQIQRQLPKEAAAQLKGTRWLWLTNPEHLEEEQRQELERLKEQFPCLAALPPGAPDASRCGRSSRTARSARPRRAWSVCGGGGTRRWR